MSKRGIRSQEDWDVLDSSLKPQAAIDLIREFGSARSAGRSVGLHHSTLNKWAKRGGYEASNGDSEKPGATITDSSADILGPRRPNSYTADELLLEFGLDPEDWDVTHVRPNVWETTVDGVPTSLYQLKISCKKRVSLDSLVPNYEPVWVAPKARKRKRQAVEYKLVFSDPHCDNHCEPLFRGMHELAYELQPSDIYCLGDGTDQGTMTRFVPNVRTMSDLQSCTHAYYDVLGGLRKACNDASITILPGNHDWWVFREIIKFCPELREYVAPGQTDPFFSFRRFMNLDSIRVDVHETLGEYHDNVIHPVDDAVFLHGVSTGKHGGATKEFDAWEGLSVFQGHDHKMAMNVITKRLANSRYSYRYAVSIGATCNVDLGYDHKHSVHQGFWILVKHADGCWHPEPVYYNNNVLSWRDFRYDG